MASLRTVGRFSWTVWIDTETWVGPPPTVIRAFSHLEGAVVKTGAGAPWTGAITPAGLRSRIWPLTGPPSPVLRLWTFDSAGAVERRTKASSETEKALQNLGYVGSKKK